MEKLLEICEELKNRGIIYRDIKQCNKHITINPNTGGSSKMWGYLANKFRDLGYEVKCDGWGYMSIYYDNKKYEIDEVFNKYLED